MNIKKKLNRKNLQEELRILQRHLDAAILKAYRIEDWVKSKNKTIDLRDEALSTFRYVNLKEDTTALLGELSYQEI